jgi:predicted RNA-binding protein YlqC (UPF0109 family)
VSAVKEFLQFVAQQLVANSDEVDVRETSGGLVSILELRVAKEDLGRVIGKRGHTVQSLRVILSAIATRNHRKVQLEVIDR